jgi:hypothetical protein
MTTSAAAQPWVSYDASYDTLPEEQCFILGEVGTPPPPTVESGYLHVGPTDGEDMLFWHREDVTIDYTNGFAIEALVLIIRSDDAFSGTTNFPRLGYTIVVTNQNRKAFFLGLASESIVLTNHPHMGVDGINSRRLAFQVAGAEHLFRIEINSAGADLFIDGELQDMHVPTSNTYTAPIPNYVWFADGTVWANSESYTRFFRFTGSTCQCLGTPVCRLYGDVAEGYCAVDVGDVLGILDGFAGVAPWDLLADIAPCGGDGNVDLGDVLAVLDAFSGSPPCPDPCPP